MPSTRHARLRALNRAARRCALAAAVATSLVAASCGGDDSPAVDTAGDTDNAADATTTTAATDDATTTTAAGTATTSASGPEAGQRVRIAIKDFSYTPDAITVKPGVVISWVNGGSTEHTVTADDGSFDFRLPKAKGVGKTFTAPGTISYHCKIHSTMKGSVTVQ